MKIALAPILVSVLALGACSSEQAAGVRGEGERPTIVSLNPCTDAIAAELAEPSQLLALSHYSHDPSASSIDPQLARQFAITGGTVEEVLAFDPDIVIADTFLQPSTKRALEALGIRVEVFDITSDIEASRDQVRRMADLLGVPDKGGELISRIDNALYDLRENASAGQPTAILWQPGGLVGGEDALVSQLLRDAGFAIHPAVRDLGQGGYLPLEMVLTDPPDILILAGATRGQRHKALEEIEGMELAHFDSSLLYCGGPSIIRAAERLAEIRGRET
ncbi:ABC transporter substrate-binding protein [Altererythrobacter sp. MF3-039]|uniref:ABC transporter substrate-binding protein n=1 Tax=Altererythrobacter sp. MF3-039 TaxID=3252901 RepID=UPI00390CCB6B